MPVQTAHYLHEQLGEMDNLINDHARPTDNLQNNEKIHFDENDEKILNATLKAFESGTLTPLIKEELRCTIQSRRLAEGKGEMKVEFKTPVRKKEMDDDERKRALKRRQQNREAAQRFRQRQKDTSDYLTVKVRKLEKSANALMDDMNRLKEEKELLGQMLKDHLSVCSNPNITNHAFVFSQDQQQQQQTPFLPTPSSAQSLLSASSTSTDTQFTFDTCSRPDSVGSCDTCSVVSPDTSDIKDQSSNSFTDMLTMSVDNGFDIDNSTTAENIIVYDGPLDGCYEEIIIDFGETETDMQNGSRMRGDSCSSVDTVSSYYCNSNTTDLTPLTEVNADFFNCSNNSAFSHSINADSTMSGSLDKNVTLTDDFFFIANDCL